MGQYFQSAMRRYGPVRFGFTALASPRIVAMVESQVLVEKPSSSGLKTILLVDDHDESRLTTKWFLSNFGYAVDSARNPSEALALFDPKIHDIIITDNSMPGMSGVEMARVIKLRSPATRVLMYTGQSPDDQSCLDLVIQRPTHLLTLKEAVEKLLAGR